MPEFLVDLLLPATDRAVTIQWAVMSPFWALVIWRTWGVQREVRQLIWGVAILNLAWFMLRMAH